MRLRPYQKRDAAVIAGWSTDERTHALWCANLIPFPAAAEEFHAYARRAEEEYGNNGFTALKDDGTPVDISGWESIRIPTAGFWDL